ncbi:phage holin family protein [Undibacterium pigrum]|uniref:Putative membrane protein YqjE n=1 Tax=Undibacterium pigrum TaxID=401470 RepID=A0A318J764_9BURK|nr:phage holin family protein [Undibacterium pigrum]PXX43885.1 putative membrane protein YqjE [Undibacterium pigrum]
MAISDSLRQVASTLSNLVHTRLELAAVELEEELAHFSSSLLWSLAALFFAGIAVLLAVLTVVAAFWDTYRYTVLLSLLALFSFLSLGIFMWLRSKFSKKSSFLSHSLAELKKDAASLRGVDTSKKEQV